MTIDQKYTSNQMSAFERKVYEHQQEKLDEVTERLVNLRANSSRTLWYYVDKYVIERDK